MLLSENGIAHGLLNTLPNSVREDKCKREGKEKAEYEKRKAHDSEKVRARYLNARNRENGQLVKPYVRYAGDPIQIWTFITDHVYTVPRGLVEEVNAVEIPRRSLEEEGNTKDTAGVKAITGTDRKGDRIHEFVPVSF